MNEDQLEEFAEEKPELVSQAQEQMREMLLRSAEDQEFRQKLLYSPREAIAEHTGQDVEDVSENIDLAFVEDEGDAEESDADATVVLPDSVDAEAKLSEDELQAVAGGEVGGTVAGGLLLASALIGAAVMGANAGGGECEAEKL